MRVRSLAALVIGGSLLLTACSDLDGSSPDTTTGTVDPDETTTTTTTTTAPASTTVPEASGLALWIASPAGIQDESGQTWATPAAGESLTDPVDDTAGGVLYLRCAAEPSPCVIEHQTAAGGTPAALGDAQRLLALGSMGGRRVLLTAWQDPTVTPSFEENTSGQFVRAIDIESRAVVGTYSWFGWESGPFAADVEQDRFAVCTGEGEACEMTTFEGAAGAPTALPGVEPATVTSLAIDGQVSAITWVTRAPLTGEVAAHRYDLASGSVADTPISEGADPGPDEAVTDGTWVAVRSGATVRAYDLAEMPGSGRSSGPNPTPTAELEVPADTTQIALRLTGGGGGVASSL